MKHETNLKETLGSFNVTCMECGSGDIKEIIDETRCWGKEVYWECLDCGNKELMFEYCE